MSDKSFGDHTNRSVVKNPLLSNVVTGLSLDDLTQKAVLLPVSPPLGVIVGSENTRSTSHTLAHTQHDQPIFSSGDADKNYPNPSNNENSYSSETKKIVKQHGISETSLLKDSVKSEDDFDVNEYFARLQGTRYVSAPIHSHIKDDQSADTEENLEEINLNEPDKPHVDVQQSLTADIAQNFSQLPTVLPHVASAVFSSFSNMLNLKSREQTLDTSKPVPGYREVEVHSSESMTVPLMGVEEPMRNIGPPPKEPPIGGSGNYRITTKKKYAQIPGLTCGDTGPNIYSAPLNPNTPLSFTPTHIERDKTSEIEDNSIDKQNITRLNATHSIPATVPAYDNFEDNQNVFKQTGYFNPVETTVQFNFKDGDSDRKQNTYNIFNPAENYVQSSSNISDSQAGIEEQPNFFEITNKKEINDDKNPTTSTSIQDINMALGSAPVVPPPPPTFTNISRHRPSVGKSILPPSVARRISANQPIIKPQSVTPIVVDNIFTPTLVHDTFGQSYTASDFEDTLRSTQSSDATYSPPSNIFPQLPLQFTTAIVHASSTFYTSAPNTQIPSTEKPPASKPTVVSMFMPAIDAPETIPTLDSISSSKMSVDLFIASKEESQKSLLQCSETVVDQSNFKKVNTKMPSSIQAPEGSTHPMFDLAETTCDVSSSKTITSSNIYPPVIAQPQPSVSSLLHESSQTEDENKEIQQIDQAQCAIKFFDPGTFSSEPSLPITEPPKTSNSFNYRMTKKKPQYYSGPIDGVGSVSNNVKPLIHPLEAGSFSGALYTPEQQLDSNNMEILSMPFDINKPTPIASVPFDINKVRVQPDYDTSFDLSRQTTQMEIPKQESKGFGIIGSLKSKLSSIDINKIQNSVTTFFDPGYNDVTTNTADKQENVPYYHQNPPSRKTSFDIYIPNVQLGSEPHDGQIVHDFSHSYHNTNKTQNTFDYYQNLERDILPVSSYFTHPDDSISMKPTYDRIVDRNDAVSYSNYTGISQSDITKPDNKNVPKASSFVKNISLPGTDHSDTDSGFSIQKQKNYDDPTYISKTYKQEKLEHNIVHSNKEFTQDTIKATSDLAGISFFDTPFIDQQTFCPPVALQSRPLESAIADDSYTNKGIEDTKNNVFKPQIQTFALPTLDMAKQDNLLKKVFDTEEKKIQKLSENILDFVPLYHTTSTNTEFVDPFMHIKLENQELCPEIQIRETNLLESLSTDAIPIVAVSSVPLFGLSTIIAEKPKEAVASECKKSEGSLTKAQRPYDKKAAAKFFENIPPREIIKPQNNKVPRDIRKIKEFYAPRVQEPEIESDLNICETCREFNKHEERETEDLTTHLIENITAPIQLSNPVEAPFTDGDTTQTRVEFDRDQYEKLSRIAEDTIESIHMHSANELLDDTPIVKPRGRSNFGWNVNNSTLKDDDDFKFKQESRSSAFYENNVPFFDKVLSNVIEDIKTEFNNPKIDEQASAALNNTLPSAEAATSDENASRSEAVGHIDVHMIEQDANRDFPLYVIEPSDSEDGMDIKEIEKFEDTGIRMESFTNRIERFKKREETKVDNPEIYGQNLSSVNSPSVPIASYFDTGNYAAETHYRNSLYSPSSSNYVGSSSHPIRIPPGFEEEYHRRMSGVSNSLLTSSLGSDSKSNEPIAPETSTTMSKEVTSTYEETDTRDIDDTFDVQSHLTNLVDESETPPSPPNNKLRKPILAMIFDADSGQIDVDYKDTRAMKGSDSMSPTEPPYIIPGHRVEFVERESDTESFNRLASYFDSPPKTEHSKSFFELSQSENHYRNNSNENHIKQDSTPHSNDNEIRNNAVNLNLMRELTSSDNMEVPEDDANRIVHYFSYKSDRDVKTVLGEVRNRMYGNVDNKLNTNYSYQHGLDEYIKNSRSFYPIKPDSNCETYTNERKSDSKHTFNDKNENLESHASDERDDENLHTIVNKCDICSNYININEGSYKFKKLMNDSAASDKEFDRNMAQNSEHSRRSVTVNFDTYSLQDDTNDGVTVSNENRTTSEYTPVKHHWFYRVDVDDKSIWRGFSVVDSTALEEAYVSQHLTEETVVPTDGGRYDVNIFGRIRRPVYWNDKPTNVRRCSWFYKGTTDARYVPYTENVAEKLEEEYRHGMTTGEWHRQLILPNNELVVMHGPSVMVHFLHGGTPDPFSTSPLFTFGKRVYRNPLKIRVARDQPEKIDHLILLVHGAGEYRSQKEKIQSTSRPRVVRRGHDESEIEDTEPSSIDHILLLCHGVGSACDMRFRNVEEVVDDFRAISLQLVQSHYRNSYENGTVNRVEVLPISWHSTLHSGEDGVDRRLAQITLDSIPRLRNFTNDTVLDVLFYTSPVYCQTIIDTVCNELNRIYSLFLQRNPGFKGGVSLGGHSLGSVILYDLLCHQEPKPEDSSADKCFVKNSNGGCSTQPNVKYPKLIFNPAALYALGSPIAIFECIRGVESLGMEFALPTCRNFFNIFHPYDPIAYRIEPLINPQLRNVKPLLVPHHKGRKRMHLELKDTMVRVGADLKQKFIESIRTTWNKWKTPTPTDGQLEKVVEEEMEKEQLNEERKEESTQNETATPDMLGKLNGGRRIDYVLQEAPLEVINEYLFAMSSHVGYWESEDTMLMMLREIYEGLGVQPDSTVPQQNLTVQRTRTVKQNETIVIDQPTTSRDSP